MKKLLFAMLLLATLQSNGQGIYYPQGRSVITFAKRQVETDSVCKKRGHVWQNISPVLSFFLNGKPDTTKFPVKQDSYIKDDKDTSWRITSLIWNYSCERCKQDSTSIKKEIIWHKP